MKYHIFDLAFAKGTSEPVRQALIAHAEEIEQLKQIKDDLNARLITATLINTALKRRIAELEQALQLMIDTFDNGGWPTATIVIARKALEGKS